MPHSRQKTDLRNAPRTASNDRSEDTRENAIGMIGAGCLPLAAAGLKTSAQVIAWATGATQIRPPLPPLVDASLEPPQSTVLGRCLVGSKNGTRTTSASTMPSFGSCTFTRVPRRQCVRGMTASAMFDPTFGDQKALVT